MMSTPTFDATSLIEATTPCRARTGSRDAANEVVELKVHEGNEIVTAVKRIAVTTKRNGAWALVDLI
jgi:hypothetical protein